MSELDWIKFSLLSNCQSAQCLVSGIVNVLALLFPQQNDKSSTPGLKSNTPTPRNDAPTPGTSSTPGLRPILGKPPGMDALGWYRSLSSLATEIIFFRPLPLYGHVKSFSCLCPQQPQLCVPLCPSQAPTLPPLP